MVSVAAIRSAFEEHFKYFEDEEGNVRDAKPLVTQYYVMRGGGGVGWDLKTKAVHDVYLNGATLSFAIELVSKEVTFTQASVDRAQAIKDLYIASPLFIDVKTYLLEGFPSADYIRKRSIQLHDRFIREMAIEFYQVEDAEKYVKAYRRCRNIKLVLEIMKTRYYSPWRNTKDCGWIAKLPDFTDDFMVAEYNRLDRGIIGCKDQNPKSQSRKCVSFIESESS